jgi:hypothetical protein
MGSLHEYMYLHDYQLDVGGGGGGDPSAAGSPPSNHVFLDTQGGPGRLHRHQSGGDDGSERRYCPWCVDHGTANSLRAGCEFNTVVFSVIDPRLWDFVESLLPPPPSPESGGGQRCVWPPTTSNNPDRF